MNARSCVLLQVVQRILLLIRCMRESVHQHLGEGLQAHLGFYLKDLFRQMALNANKCCSRLTYDAVSRNDFTELSESSKLWILHACGGTCATIPETIQRTHPVQAASQPQRKRFLLKPRLNNIHQTRCSGDQGIEHTNRATPPLLQNCNKMGPQRHAVFVKCLFHPDVTEGHKELISRPRRQAWEREGVGHLC